MGLLKRFTMMLALPLLVNASGIDSSIGKGVSSFEKEQGLKDRCVQLKKADIFKEDVRSTSYSLLLVKNKEELYDKISMSSEAEGSYGSFSAQAKASFVREIKWNFNSNYILVRAKRITYRDSISSENILLSKKSRQLALDSKFRFLESCGNAFAKTIEYGGELYGVIEITASTYSEKQQIESSLSASGSYAGASGSGSTNYQRTIKKISENFKAKVDLRHTGGSHIAIPSTVEGLLNVSSKIEEITDSHPVPVAISTRAYTTLANFEHDDINYETMLRQEALDFANTKLTQVRKIYAQLVTVLEFPKKFRRHDSSYIKEKLNYLDMKILELKDFISRGYSFLNEVDPTKIDIDLEIEIPKRKRGLFRRNALAVSCEMKRSPICGVESYRETRTSACNVNGVNEGTGPACGTVYKEKASNFCGVKLYNTNSGSVCGVSRYKQCHSSACGKKWDGSRKRCRHKSCGVQAYKTCAHKSFGVKSYNTCRNEQHGVEKFLTCESKEFGYNFQSCQHLSHGPAKYKACSVAEIGNQTTVCPKL